MHNLTLLTAASLLATTSLAMAQASRSYGDEQDIGGHYRHMHRDWSQQEGHHVHNACWEWNPGAGWVWVCRN